MRSLALFLIFAIPTMIRDEGVIIGVIIECEAHIKVPTAAVSTFLQNEDLSPYKKKIAILILRPLHCPIVKFYENGH